ncbi:hypothetical protein [Deinococcus cellulosilyticus]|uniref:Uncharacterized protein n=1 Tax=Deinococcus cellulosilyticus (strain DSM 18568 / NBRC 106333 / KACC 11606 / 5516J-15) TaxID=1223518 RepID=A0A511NB95_DEIC1|nr:hypothetical protein [Deinococcus cellulosilyticus]GEM50074.1 hypothetical protein DC3_57090 [Deinococcus cellulosilyticus NBRC 106333 = KACC 11606]
MSTSDYSLNFSALEWEELCQVPVLAGIVVMDAHPSGWLGTLEELKRLKASIEPSEQDHPLVAEVKKSIVAQDLIGPERETPFEQIRDRTLSMLRGLSEALKEKVDDDARSAYITFVKTVMLQVAEAFREGGLLSTQRDNISEQERAIIDELSAVIDPVV